MQFSTAAKHHVAPEYKRRAFPSKIMFANLKRYATPQNVAKLRRAFQVGRKAYQGYNRIQNLYQKHGKGRNTIGVGVTNEYQRQGVYRKKKMNKYKKRKYKKFYRKVTGVINKSLGAQTILMNKALTRTNVANEQSFMHLCMYGKNGVDSIAEAGNTALATFLKPGIFAKNAKVIIDTAIMDLTFTNTSTGANQTTLEVDIYDIVYHKSSDYRGDKIEDAIVAGQDLPNVISGAASGIRIFDRGATPFELPLMISTAKMKILSKKKYMLSPGQSFTYQNRESKHFQLDMNEVFNGQTGATPTATGYILPGRTRSTFVIFKPVAGSQALTGTLACGATFKYLYRVLEASTSNDGVYTI